MVQQVGLPPNQKETASFPVLHYGPVPHLDPSAWTFRIGGRVRQPVSLSFEQMLALPRKTVTTDIHCVTGWSKRATTWTGVATRTVFELIEPLPDAAFIMVTGANDYTTNLALDDFLADQALFAFEYAGAPLAPKHGGPMRLVVPHLYFWKSAKWVTGFDVMEENRPGFWEERGYHMRGDPWQEERYW